MKLGLLFKKVRTALLPKVAFIVAFLILLTYGAIAVFAVSREKKTRDDFLRQLGSTIAANLAYNAEYPVLIGNREMLGDMLRGVFKQRWVISASIQDADGNTLAAVGDVPERRFSAGDLKSKPPVWFSQPEKVLLETYALVRRTRGLTVPDELDEPSTREAAGEVVGVARVGISRRGLLADLRLTRWRAGLLTLAIAAAGSVSLVLMMKRTIISPLDTLLEGTRKIQAGELSFRVGIHTTDEIGELAASFNSMAEALQRHTQNLSQLVEEKTHDIEKVNRELKDFVYIVSHDLKEPLRGIESFSQFLLEDCQDRLEGEAKEYLSGIREGAMRMKRLIEDLLLLSRVTRIKNPYRVASLEHMVRDAVESLRYAIEEKNAQVIVQPEMLWVLCDEIKMTEVFKNLLSNAIKFAREMPPRVEFGCVVEGDSCKVFVKDNGIGIEEKHLEKIFEVFQRLHRREEYEGTGLGLHLVKKIVEEHGGRVWAESTPGVGSTFWFTLPNCRRDHPAAPPSHAKVLGEHLIEEEESALPGKQEWGNGSPSAGEEKAT